jgi:hypothetical protein
VRVVLVKPIVGVQKDTCIAETLPCGACVELPSRCAEEGLANISWNGSCFSVFREDLLDACTVDDVWRVSFF